MAKAKKSPKPAAKTVSKSKTTPKSKTKAKSKAKAKSSAKAKNIAKAGSKTKSDAKTVQTRILPARFIQSVENKTRQQDAAFLLPWFTEVTGYEPVMWGPSIIGYGRYYYKYDSGHEGEFMITGFSPRKANLVLYIMPGYRDLSEPLARLGKHKLGKSCLYINKLADIDLEVLAEVVTDGVSYMRKNYQTWDR